MPRHIETSKPNGNGSAVVANEGVTTVFHLGGGGTVQMTSVDDYLRMNVDATRNLLDAASDDPKRHTAKLVRPLQAIGYRVTLDEWGPRSIRAILTTALGAVVR